MKLKEIAHARTGDKGEISNISVIPYDENNYEMLKEKVTEARVAEYFREICHGKVTRYGTIQKSHIRILDIHVNPRNNTFQTIHDIRTRTFFQFFSCNHAK